jgi:hypothetical protein
MNENIQKCGFVLLSKKERFQEIPNYIFFCIFFWRARVCWPLLCYVVLFVFMRYVWIRTQRVAAASRCATNLATHLQT